jgi:WD40 repeat protein
MDACPSQHELGLLLQETLQAGREQTLVSHVESCGPCQQTLQQLSDDTTALWRPLLQPPPAGGLPFLDDLKKARPAAPAAAGNGAAAPLPSVPGYEVLKVLGRGGMGVVYLARQQSLGRLVALKTIGAGTLARPEEQARFQAEAQAVARLLHPNIVQIYEVNLRPDCPYLALEYVAGGTLAEQLGPTLPAPRRAAALVQALAEAMHHAHQHQILHRDLKPANILLTPAGVPKISDFGLAKHLERSEGLTQSGGIVGTPGYLAPEMLTGQRRQVGPAADVYGLGAVLYALLTGRPPFQGETSLETLQQSRFEEPVPPRRLRPEVPRDLETICLKCLEKEPARRFASAEALAQDLARFLAGAPIRARPAGPAERALKWMKRHPTATALLAVTVLGILAFAANENRRANEADHLRLQALEEQQRTAKVNADRLLDQQYESHFKDALLIASDRDRRAGWRARGLEMIRKAAAIRQAPALRDQAIQLLAGLDAHNEGWTVAASPRADLTFAPDGKLLLVSSDGTAPALLVDPATGARTRLARVGPGPVAVGPGGQPCQLAAGPELALTFWDLHGPARIAHLACPVKESKDWKIAETRLGHPLAVLSADGRWAAAAAAHEAEHLLAAWAAPTGKLLFTKADADIGCLAISPRGDLLAAGHRAGKDKGRVSLWSLPEGKLLATLPAAPTEVRCLAFSPTSGADDGLHGLLAVSTASESLAIWDLETGRRAVSCPGSHYEVYAVAFSPDGMTLAAADLQSVRLWDLVTGRCLLKGLGGRTLAFAPDGRRLAGIDARGGVEVWRLENGRGVQTLRGQRGQLSYVCFSSDQRLLACLSHTWQVAIWEVPAAAGWQGLGKLRWRLDVPAGFTADNAGLAFRADGRRFAFAAGEHALLLDTDTGRQLASWSLPPGLGDRLAFHAGGKLLLCRAETAGRKHFGGSAASPRDPIVIRIYALEAGRQPALIKTIADFNRRFLDAEMPADGSVLLVEGLAGEAGAEVCWVKGFDPLTGARRWQFTSPSPRHGALALDPEGKLFLVNLERTQQDARTIVEADTGQERERLHRWIHALAPDAQWLAETTISDSPSGQQGCLLFQHGRQEPVARLGSSSYPSFYPVFDRTGRRLALGNMDGTVSVFHLEAIRLELGRLGLGW